MLTGILRTLALLPGVLAIVFLAFTAHAQEITLKLHTLVPALSQPVQKFLKPWGARIEQESGGRIKVEVYPSMQLGGKPEQLVDQVRDGVVDVIWTVPGYTPGRFIKSEVFELPFMHSNPIATNAALQDFADKNGEEFSGYKVLLLHVHAGSAFHTLKPMHTADALHGMKIRTPSRTGSWMLEAMGATPIGAPVSSIPEMLSNKVVDGVTIPFEIALPLKVHEMVNYHTVLDDPKYPRPNTAVFLFAMNKDRYDKLPADLKKVIDNYAGRNISRWAGQVWIDNEKPGEDAALLKGEIFKLPPAEVAKLRKMIEKPVQDRWIEDVKSKGLDGAALVQQARSLIDKYTK